MKINVKVVVILLGNQHKYTSCMDKNGDCLDSFIHKVVLIYYKQIRCNIIWTDVRSMGIIQVKRKVDNFAFGCFFIIFLRITCFCFKYFQCSLTNVSRGNY